MGRSPHLLGILILTDDDVEPTNRSPLSRNLPADEHGPVPKVFFDHRHRSARTLANREFLVRRTVDLLRAAGARTVHRLNWPPFVFHPRSTMRMGVNEAHSICDASGAARTVQHLCIADNSVLPNSLGGPNPTVTTQALATRTAEMIFVRDFAGQAWVGWEAPVSSIDPVVTRAVLDRASKRAPLSRRPPREERSTVRADPGWYTSDWPLGPDPDRSGGGERSASPPHAWTGPVRNGVGTVDPVFELCVGEPSRTLPPPPERRHGR